ncbi:hypothetical protein B296_00051814 [Ensete ventricosum]|uniref:Uncharacterized protein n=1 Tax=Ensete ventricosum TaxID=4639 RepID=A0A426X7M5_ENSVE|nr:hypothetical protein B296_00051814 [Ensete ventricosum]
MLAIPNILANGKSYEHSFTKKHDGHKVARKVTFRSVFCAPSQKFKILVIPNVLAHGKSYEHGFTKKFNGHKLRTNSCFDLFFLHRLRNLKYRPFPMY